MDLKQIYNRLLIAIENVDDCKNNVLSYLENVYVKFLEYPNNRNKLIVDKLNQLQEEITTLKNDIDEVIKMDLVDSKNELKKHTEMLQATNTTLIVVQILYNIHEILINIQELQETESYFSCMNQIREAEDLLEDFPLKEGYILSLMKELSLVIFNEKCSLLLKLRKMFEGSVICKLEHNKCTMKIMNESNDIEEILLTLYYYKKSITVLDNLAQFLQNHVFMLIINKTVEIATITGNNYVIMEILVVDPNKKQSYSEVFVNIKTVLHFLMTNFHIKLSEELSTLNYIGRNIQENLSNLIIKQCLENTIPSNPQALHQYSSVIEATEDLEKALVKAEIFPKDSTSLLDYVSNINVLFVNKKCQIHLNLARSLMKKNLDDMIEVGTVQEIHDANKMTGDFPHCMVSRSVLELLQLLEKILSEAETSSDICAGRLLYSVKNICQLYAKFVPEYHKKFLQTIPQQIALFYNNCSYISYKLTEWNNLHLKKLPSLPNIASNSFNDEGRQLVEIASEMFSAYVERQIKQIEELLKDSGLHNQTVEQVEGCTSKCLKQCLEQLELLKIVWSQILPYSIYNKTLGIILNSLCENLVNNIIKYESISSVAAEQLVELLKMVHIQGSKLFIHPEKAGLFVENWHKLNELVFILSTNMVEINDRWANGKGPLASHFTTEEFKQLIRALFQNKN